MFTICVSVCVLASVCLHVCICVCASVILYLSYHTTFSGFGIVNINFQFKKFNFSGFEIFKDTSGHMKKQENILKDSDSSQDDLSFENQPLKSKHELFMYLCYIVF